MAVMHPMLMLIMNLTTVAVVWFGGVRIAAGEMQVGDMMAFIQYAMQIMFSFVMAAMMFVMIPRAQASAERINEVLEMEPEITDPKESKPLPAGTGGRIKFENVSFRYPGAEEAALSGISFETGPGEITAVIGGTGSGKSTLVNLIPRFYDISEGKILVDGISVSELSQSSLRSRIGYVPQQAVLFTGSVSDNIRYGNREATDEEVLHAAGVAQAADFIADMPEGFGTSISQGGVNLSGGQKQRISIARALVRKPEIYIFDDCFSALDFKTDPLLRAALRKETGDSAVIIVAQRASTVMDADRILVLDDGKPAGMGRHRDLMKSCRFTGKSSRRSSPKKRSKRRYGITKTLPGRRRRSPGRRPMLMSNNGGPVENCRHNKNDSFVANRPMGGRRHGPAGGLAMPMEKAKDFKGTFKRMAGYLAPQKFRFLRWHLAVFIVFSILGRKSRNGYDRIAEGDMERLEQIGASRNPRFIH
jgi:ABC-type multidrug transport system fused ATPase/permease subunit